MVSDVRETEVLSQRVTFQWAEVRVYTNRQRVRSRFKSSNQLKKISTSLFATFAASNKMSSDFNLSEALDR